MFHSDFLLQEGDYSLGVCKEIAKYPRQLHAVSIKGADAQEFKTNTGVDCNIARLWRTLETLQTAEVPFYLTFTGMTKEGIQTFSDVVARRFGKEVLADSFGINIIHYDALD